MLRKSSTLAVALWIGLVVRPAAAYVPGQAPLRPTVERIITELGTSTEGLSAEDLRAMAYEPSTWHEDGDFVVAYDAKLPSGRLEMRVARKAGAAPWRQRRMGAMPVNIGTVVRVQVIGGNIYVDTHATPSAGGAVVLSSSLETIAFLPGRVVAGAGGLIVISRDLVHFAPGSPESLAVFDPGDGIVARLYPSDGTDDLTKPATPSKAGAIRQEYMSRLTPLLDAARKTDDGGVYGWMADWFDVSIYADSLRYDVRTDTLTFDARFSYPRLAGAPLQQIVVTCRPLHETTRRCTEAAK